MKILFVASEAAPLAKTGGLADVAGSLPRELKRLGHDVRIVLPLYREVSRGGVSLHPCLDSLSVELGGEVETGAVFRTESQGVTVYLVANEALYDRQYLYGTPTGDYADNARRFAFFCRGVLQFLERADFRPDLLHCHDWQAALLPLLLRYDPAFSARFRETATLFTIHNLAYHGLFSRSELPDLGLDDSYFTIDRLEYYGSINLLKGGILSSDLINTVSETYCREIQTPEYGCGLDGVLRVRKGDLSGIVNGLDYSEWDPAADRFLPVPFSAEQPEGKAASKAGLQRRLGLRQSPEIPLVGIVSRLAAQKGFDLLGKILPGLGAGKLQLAVLGSGEEKYAAVLRSWAASAGNISFTFGFDDDLAHNIYAGSDLFLMPSHYEPCGLGQLIALRYGAVPVVRKTGGLADTVADPSDSPEPTGFSFGPYDAAALRETLGRAIACWQDRERWSEIMIRGMRQDFSWSSSAQKYDELYRRAVLKKRGSGNG